MAQAHVATGAGVEREADEELARRAQAGDARALESLIARYRGAARGKVSNYFLIGAEREDLLQEAYIGLTKAVRDFDPQHGASFASFADLCITRQILTAIKTATRLKHSPLNSYVSFDRPHDDDPTRTLADTVAIEPDADPLDQLVADDDLRTLRRIVGDVLSDLESRVLRLYVEGRSYQEIADLLGRQVKSIDNALQRIKRKLEGRIAADGAA
jgi:RNA polymerase sporulation-specific sigma factor